MLKKCFGGLRSVCESAENRLDDVLTEGTVLDLTVGEGRIQWK